VSEGPEVRRVARRLDRAVRGAELLRIETRLRKARAWLEAHPGFFDRAHSERVESCGKHLLFRLDGGRWIHAHLLMFGSWRVLRPDAPIGTRMTGPRS
jgi:endonuclease-8